MINNLAKKYSKTLLVLFIISTVGPLVSRTVMEMQFDTWPQIISYIFTILSAVAATCISFFTNTTSNDEL